MKKTIRLMSVVISIFTLTFLSQCTKKNEEVSLSLSSITAGTSDLNGATSPTNVAVDAVIMATFSTDIDPASVTASTVVLKRDYDDSVMAATATVSGKTITVTPTDHFGNGTKYLVDFDGTVKSTGGKMLGQTEERAFTTVGFFAPAGAFAYWNFDGNANDQMGNFNPSANGIIGLTFVAARKDSAGQAAKFDGSTTLVEIPNGDQLAKTSDFTLSFWVKEDSTGKRDQFVMGLAAWYGFQFEINNNGNGGLGECKLAAQYELSGDTTSASQDLWFNGGSSGTTKDNGGWKGWTFCKDLSSNNGTGVNGLLAERWADVVCVYNSATKVGTIYINGEKMKEQDFNLYGTDHPLYNATGLTFA